MLLQRADGAELLQVRGGAVRGVTDSVGTGVAAFPRVWPARLANTFASKAALSSAT